MNKLFFDLFPLILFGVLYWWKDIYWGTAGAIIGAALQVGYLYVRRMKIEPSHIITLVVLIVFGGMTLFLQDDRFIKLKPSIVNVVLGILMVGPQLLGRTPSLKLLMGEHFALPDSAWKTACWQWAIFMIVCGALNIYVAFYYGVDTLDEETRTSLWVKFKIFGLLGLTLVFAIAQSFWLTQKAEKISGDVKPEA